jgi:DNA-binding transcriptional regulator YiaG
VTVERSGRGQAANISWSVRAGHWAYGWFNASGRVFVGRMARALLELDHRENRGAAILAKKIGQLVLLQAGSDRQSRLAVIVSTLLTDIGELPVEKARTKDWAGRTRDRLDDALLSLLEAGIFVHIDWPDGYGPSDEDRQRGWVDHWLAARIELSLAMPMAPNQITDQPPAELLLQTPDVIPESAPMEEAPISGQMIRRARAARKWKQEQLARYLSISVPYLSQIEGDRRQPSPQLSARLRTWLAEPDA